jgi:hypothetical protein
VATGQPHSETYPSTSWKCNCIHVFVVGV